MAANTSVGAEGMRRLMQYSDIMLAVAMVVIVGVLIIPLPESILDILITVNIAAALVILLVSLYTLEPLQFSVFPSLLLIATLYRLALNVSASKLILLQANAGSVIDAFGAFVVGGNYVVGVAIFLIIVVIQFVVITNGAGRVAEVAARFTLDAMPGKQMSIDADLNAGFITEAEARARRRSIEQEADFYGAMDGASKFVKGDAIAGIVIILINILGGIAIGVAQLGMPLGDALARYTILTIGDGLVSQIPAILLSTATGITVTRAASSAHLGEDIARQILSNPRAIAIVAALLLGLGLVPGLPQLPFFVIGGLLGVTSYMLNQTGGIADVRELELAQAEPATGKESLSDLLHLDAMELEIGYGIIPLVDVAQGGNLLGRITLTRRQVALDLGIILPTVRIRDSVQLPPNSYQLKIRGVVVAKGEVRPGRYLAMDPGTVVEPVQGIATTEPVFGLPALWIASEDRERAEILGYTVIDPSSVLTTHLSEVIQINAPMLLGRQDVQNLIENVKSNYPAVVEDVIPNLLSLSEVQRVLQNLLRERVSIRDLITILETMAHYAKLTTDPDSLTERVRQALSRSICAQYTDASGAMHAITLTPHLQQTLGQALQPTDQGLSLVLEMGFAQGVLRRLAGEMERVAAAGHRPVLICPTNLRLPLRRLVGRSVPTLAVLSYAEVAAGVEVRTEGMVAYEMAAGGVQ